MLREEPKSGEVWKHFKGNTYEIICVAVHSETNERLVVYRALYGEGLCYTRPIEMFMSFVDREKYPEAVQRFRFERCGD